jgi:D-lactate dehydrogenase
VSVIVFYEATPIDTFQLTDALRGTDHYWQYIEKTITQDTINPDAEVVSIFVDSVITREIMDRMPKLKLIATRSSGFDHIDLDHARMRNITVVNVPSFGENTVAEHAFALLLMLVRKLPGAMKATREGTYVSPDFIGTDLKGRTLGIIGMGQIGRYMARMARGFQMSVIACDHHRDDALAERLGFRYVEFDQVLTQSDVVSLHTPLTPDTYHMINQGTIERMKKGAILINTARGELVENRALVTALHEGRLAGAGLDTLEGERFLRTSSIIDNLVQKAASPESYLHTAETAALLKMPNVVITPHSAFNTTDAIKRINDCTAKNIIDFWYGKSPNRVAAPKSSGKLVIVRHGQSEWNALGKWTGTTDVHITQKGIDESAEIGRRLRDIKFDYAYISQQIRTRETLEAIKNGSQQLDLRYEHAGALNERDYGIYTGMRKNDIQKVIGEEAYNELRRSWDSPVEGGESLKDVYERVIPFYLRIILPRLRHGQNVLVVAHGNSIRSLIKYIENNSDSEVGEMEMIQGCALEYEVDVEGRSKQKDVIELSTSSDVEP